MRRERWRPFVHALDIRTLIMYRWMCLEHSQRYQEAHFSTPKEWHVGPHLHCYLDIEY